ncbi:MAG: AAA family ATPase [Lachnospiraceae bacterium]|nr:AAA family ATPase [Lachnospiraceae bacterium]
MEQIFISKIKIDKVRHLSGIEIPLSETGKKHLILTGKNGSGKTSLLDAMSDFLYSITSKKELHTVNRLNEYHKAFSRPSPDKKPSELTDWENELEETSCGVVLKFNQNLFKVYHLFQNGQFVVAYYKAERAFQAPEPKQVEKVELKETYSIQETPRKEFVKYLLDMKMTEALAIANGKKERADQIHLWFERFQALLQELFEDNSVQLEFDMDTFRFSLVMDGREPFGFNALSGGYAAILDMVADLILRMEKHSDKVFDFHMPGIVLIDEIETHLHLDLQRKILPFLTELFPNVQFIVSTHSPFILNSLEDVVIYDLENHTLVENGLANVPYGGIVEGYFKANEMSDTLKAKYERYRELTSQPTLSDDDMDELSGLELYLDEIPDYLALDITTEYQRLKQELRTRGNV